MPVNESLTTPSTCSLGGIDFSTLTELTSINTDSDFISFLDTSAGDTFKISRQNLVQDSTIRRSIDSLSFSGGEMIYAVSSSQFSKSATGGFGRILISSETSASARTSLGLLIGSDILSYSAGMADLSSELAIGGANDLLYLTGANSVSRLAMSAYVRDNILSIASSSALATEISAISFSSATDNRLIKWNGTGGSAQDTGITCNDSNELSGIASITTTGNINGVSPTEMTQLANIGATTISTSQWGYLGQQNQALTQASDVNFNTLTTVAGITVGSASAFSGAVNMNSNKITNLGAPTTGSDATTKTYVDSVAGSGISPIEEVRVGSTADLGTYAKGAGDRGVITAGSNGAITINGVSLSLNDRILVKDQNNNTENGVYQVIVQGSGSTPYQIERTSDFHAGVAPVSAGTYVLVIAGNTLAGSAWVLDADITTFDTDPIVWDKFSISINAGSGLTLSDGAYSVNVVGTSGNIYINGSDQIDINGQLSIIKGGTGASSFTADEIVKVNSAATAFESSGISLSDLVQLTSTQTLTNKTINDTSNNITANALWNQSGTRVLINNAGSALNQVLKITSTSPLEAGWGGGVVDINGLSAITTTENISDELILWDNSASANKKITITNFATQLPANLPAGYVIVSSSGGDYTSIATAMSTESAGAVILVYPGDYNEDLVFTKSQKVIGLKAPLSVKIKGSSATSTRVIFNTGITTATLGGITVYAPSSGGGYAIDTTNIGTSELVLLDMVVIVGQSNTSSGLNMDGGKVGITNGFYHNGGALNNVINISGGHLTMEQAVFYTGSAVNCINQTGGEIHLQNIILGDSSLYSCVDMFDISGGMLDINCLTLPDTTPATNAIHISGDSVNISAISCKLLASAYDVLIDGDLTGLNSTFVFSGKLDLEKTSYPTVWATNAKLVVSHSDIGENEDPGYKVVGNGFVVGVPDAPTESVFGEGDSTTLSMLVYTSTDVTNIAGATYNDLTQEAKSTSDSSFTAFPALTNGAGIFLGNSRRKFFGVKLSITTAMTLGTGITSWWYYNGAEWVEFEIMCSKSSQPFNQYNRVWANAVHGEQIRFDFNTLNVDWDTITVNGQSAYWVYVRIGRDANDTIYPTIRPQNTNSITTAPVLERIKLHTNRTEINGQGAVEYFGIGQPRINLPLKERRANTQKSASSATFNLSSGASTEKPFSSFTNNSESGFLINTTIPQSLDTSRHTIVQISWCMAGAQTGNVRLYCYLIAGQTANAQIDNGTLTEISFHDQANQTNEFVDFNIASDQTGILKVAIFETIIPNLIAEEEITLSVYRDATNGNASDTNSGTIKIFDIGCYGFQWRN